MRPRHALRREGRVRKRLTISGPRPLYVTHGDTHVILGPVLCGNRNVSRSCNVPAVEPKDAAEPLPALDRPIDAGVGGRWHEQLAAQRLGTFRRVRLMLLGPRTRGARLAHAHKERAPQIRSTGENQKEAPARYRRHACQAGP